MEVFMRTHQGEEYKMRKVENLGGKLLGMGLALLIGTGAAWGTWRDMQPKFRDVTINAGEAMPALGDFTTAYAVAEKCDFVTDMTVLDSDDVGEHNIVLRQGAREAVVTLRILDTIAPELEVRDLELTPEVQITPEAAVVHLWDHSQVKLSFDREINIPEDYSPFILGLTAEDTSGNITREDVTVSVNWLRESVELEYGQKLTREMLLYAPEKDAALISDEALSDISNASLGEYQITSTSGGRTLTCRVTVQDTQGPVLELREHQVYLNGNVTVQDFVVSATDPSGEVTLTMLTQPDCAAVSTHTIVVEARDVHGNVTTAETQLYVVTDMIPPVISGVQEALSVEKHSDPDYLAGVSATDDKAGQVEVTVDASKVNTAVAGTYVVIYTARDSSGNVTTVRRMVHVKHDAEDTAALVASIAEGLENDPENIRDYVRSSIRYSTNWGGEDPVWLGFTEKHGNCYVHALCLKAILDQKGYNTQLIWVYNKSHYWLIIEIEPGVWRHIDPTPSDVHSRFSLMTDEQRQWTLSGRLWDRSQWPACE